MAFNGERLRKIRRLHDLTQVELARAVGASQRMISSYERGKDMPRSDMLYSICKALKVSADYLLEFIDSAEAPLSSDQITLLELGRRVGYKTARDALMLQTMSNRPVSDQ